MGKPNSFTNEETENEYRVNTGTVWIAKHVKERLGITEQLLNHERAVWKIPVYQNGMAGHLTTKLDKSSTGQH